jgi:hypothetical protein
MAEDKIEDEGVAVLDRTLPDYIADQMKEEARRAYATSFLSSSSEDNVGANTPDSVDSDGNSVKPDTKDQDEGIDFVEYRDDSEYVSPEEEAARDAAAKSNDSVDEVEIVTHKV